LQEEAAERLANLSGPLCVTQNGICEAYPKSGYQDDEEQIRTAKRGAELAPKGKMPESGVLRAPKKL